jgi:hypothetical protein
VGGWLQEKCVEIEKKLNDINDPAKFVTPRYAGQIANRTAASMRENFKQGKLHGFRVGGRIRISVKSLDDFVKSNQKAA